MELSLHNASQKHLKNNRHSHYKKILSPPEKLISVILGIVWFALLVTLVIMTRIVFPYNNLSSAQPCGSCPKEWMSYSHNCYYISVQKKNWTDSLVSCNAKNSSLLYIESEEELNFLQSLSLITWTSIFRKRRDQPWVLKKDSTFTPRITELFHGEHNCVMLSTSGLPADDCAVLHIYLCKHKLTN
ncbi:NKG2-A/NKG2-B type II integral membrane protein-like isoform X1 [Microtus pennsylvanicus]|uniref:NKG2-A/NKG2-B type II integral membrane protein-like isoform X1 n=1 Tax=Microtus pennsylvanicus TaxID=10058 RepID=UPI003F6CA4AF